MKVEEMPSYAVLITEDCANFDGNEWFGRFDLYIAVDSKGNYFGVNDFDNIYNPYTGVKINTFFNCLNEETGEVWFDKDA